MCKMAIAISLSISKYIIYDNKIYVNKKLFLFLIYIMYVIEHILNFLYNIYFIKNMIKINMIKKLY